LPRWPAVRFLPEKGDERRSAFGSTGWSRRPCRGLEPAFATVGVASVVSNIGSWMYSAASGGRVTDREQGECASHLQFGDPAARRTR
jgi:hypothetical protein